MTVADCARFRTSPASAAPNSSRAANNQADLETGRCMVRYIARRPATCQNAIPAWTKKRLQCAMIRKIIVLCSLAALAACTTYKLWTESASDSDLGIVQLSYEYHKFENPQVDERAGISM